MEIIDFTALQKRGLLKKIKTKDKNIKYQSQYLNLSKSRPLPTLPSIPQSETQNQNPFAFLDSLANASKTQQPAMQDNSDMQYIQTKIENIEHQLSQLLERLEAIESKVKEI